VKSRKDKKSGKSSKFRGKSQKNIKVGRKSFSRKMTGGAGGWDKTKGIVHNLTGVSTRHLWHNMRGSKYQSARLKPYIDGIDTARLKSYIDGIDEIFDIGTYKTKVDIQNEIDKFFSGSKSILTELQPYIDTKFTEKNKNDYEMNKERQEIQDRNERETKELKKKYEDLEKEEMDKAKIVIDNIFNDTNKSVEEIIIELNDFSIRINSLTHVDGSFILEQINPYILTKLNDWSEKKIKDMISPYNR